jgi:hypothetical protein
MVARITKRSAVALPRHFGVVATPAIALPGSCSALIRAGSSQDHCQTGPRIARTLCVAPLEQGARRCIFCPRGANRRAASVYVAPLEMLGWHQYI